MKKMISCFIVLLLLLLFSSSIISAQSLPEVVVLGVAANNSSAKISFQPITGAKDYRLYDVSNPTYVKYAGMRHYSNYPGWCNCHFDTLADKTTIKFPYTLVPNTSSQNTPSSFDAPATEIEWNVLDDQPHTLVVEAVDALGPIPYANQYDINSYNQPLVNPLPVDAMLGMNKGPTNDGKNSTNGQGPSTNNPRIIGKSKPFVVRRNPNRYAIPSTPSATQTFFDTFDDTESSSLQLIGTVDPNAGTKRYSLNKNTSKEWELIYKNADTKDSLPFIQSGHFMDTLFDGGTPGSNNPAHIAHGVFAMSPVQTVDFSNGKLLHLTMEVDGHMSGRRWMAFNLAPATDPLIDWYRTLGAINTSDTAIFQEMFPGSCTLQVLTGPKSSTDTSPTGKEFWGAAGQAPFDCYPSINFGGNGISLDNRSRYDLFLTQQHAALFQDGQLIIQSTIDSVSFTKAKVYFTHYLYHTENDRQELQTYAPWEQYWINNFPWSDERHWDNMGFEVLPASEVPTGNDWSSLSALVQLPNYAAPVFADTSPPISPSSTPQPVIGDTNNDRLVDILDYQVVVSHIGQSGSVSNGDVTNDGKINLFDYSAVVSNFHP